MKVRGILSDKAALKECGEWKAVQRMTERRATKRSESFGQGKTLSRVLQKNLWSAERKDIAWSGPTFHLCGSRFQVPKIN